MDLAVLLANLAPLEIIGVSLSDLSDPTSWRFDAAAPLPDATVAKAVAVVQAWQMTPVAPDPIAALTARVDALSASVQTLSTTVTTIETSLPTVPTTPTPTPITPVTPTP